MNKFFKIIDALPLVKILQIAAVIIFLMGLHHIVLIWFQPFRTYAGVSKDALISALQLTAMSFAQILFSPLVLLALAQILKKK